MSALPSIAFFEKPEFDNYDIVITSLLLDAIDGKFPPGYKIYSKSEKTDNAKSVAKKIETITDFYQKFKSKPVNYHPLLVFDGEYHVTQKKFVAACMFQLGMKSINGYINKKKTPPMKYNMEYLLKTFSKGEVKRIVAKKDYFLDLFSQV